MNKVMAEEILLTRAELLQLASLAGVKSVIGLEITPEEFEQSSLIKKEIDQRLSTLGLLGNKKTISTLAQTLMHPERALLVVRDRVGIGRQILIFLCRQKQCLLHSFPKEGQHRVIETNPAEIEKILQEWLPAGKKTGTESRAILIQDAHLKEMIAAVLKGDKPALPLDIDPISGSQLTHSLQKRTWSASLLLLQLKNLEVVNADSFTAWSDGKDVWTAELFSPSGVMRIFSDSINYQGLLKQLIRTLVQFDQIVRAYHLSGAELAFALTTLNRGDLAGRLIHQVYPKSTDKNDNWKAAGDSLRARGLSSASPVGFPILSNDFEQALIPVILHTHIGRIRTVSPQGVSEGTLYIQKDRSFSTHFSSGDKHVLESGNWDHLPTYLLKLFRDFGNQKITRSKSAALSLKTLTGLLETSDQKIIEQILRQTGLPGKFSTEMSMDMANPVYRASIIIIETPRNNKDQQQDDGYPMLLLLKGKQRDWMFSFSSQHADSIGQAVQSDHKQFLTALMTHLT